MKHLLSNIPLATKIWISLSGTTGLLMLLFEPTRHLGHGFSLFTALCASLGAGIIAAGLPHRIRCQLESFPGASHTVLRLTSSALGRTAPLTLLPLAINLLFGLYAPQCNLVRGLIEYALINGFSVLAATVIGLLCGLVLPGKRLPVIGAAGIWLGSLIHGGLSLYHSPAIFAFGPFYGYLNATLYERHLDYIATLAVYRGYTLILLVAILLWCAAFINPEKMRLSLLARRLSPGRIGLLTILVSAVFGFQYYSDHLGITTSTDYLKTKLSAHRKIDSLDIYFAPSIPPKRQRAFTEDAAFSLHQVSTALGVTPSARQTVFVFESDAQKKKLLGIETTSVAKPWLRQTYITIHPPPHYTLRHELVHLVARDIADGYFGVPGRLNGLIPSPAIVEGLAVAFGGNDRDLGHHEYAKGMKDTQLLPPLQHLFGSGFYRVSSSQAYLAAGSVFAFIQERHGRPSMKRLYRSGDVSTALKMSIAALERDWHDYLDQIPLTDDERRIIGEVFDTPALVHIRCLHEVTRLKKEQHALEYAHQRDAALQAAKDAYRISGQAIPQRLTLISAYLDRGETDLANRLINTHTDAEWGVLNHQFIQERIADTSFPSPKAHTQYRSLSHRATRLADQRRLFVKSHISATAPHLGHIIIKKLSGDRDTHALDYALTLAARLSDTTDPVIRYLAARIAAHRETYLAVRTLLPPATIAHLGAIAPPAIHTEALFISGKSHYFTGHLDTAHRTFTHLKNATETTSGQRFRAADWLQRIEWKQSVHTDNSNDTGQ